MAGWRRSTKSLSHLPEENLFSSHLICFWERGWGDLNVAVCLSYSEASPPDRSFFASFPQDAIHSANRKETLPIVFFCFVFQIHFLSGRWKYPFLPDLGTNTSGHYYDYYDYFCSSWFQGLLRSRSSWPEMHPTSPCFLEYVQWKDNFTPELV